MPILLHNKKSSNKSLKTIIHSSGFVLIEILVSLIVSSVMLVGIMDEMHMIWLKRQRINTDINDLFLSRNVISTFDRKGWSGPGVWNGVDGNVSWVLEAENMEYDNNDNNYDALNNKDNATYIKALSIHIYVIRNDYKINILNSIRIYKENEKQ